MATWPLDLPRLRILPIELEPFDSKIESDVDVGPPKVRRRPAPSTLRFSLPLILSAYQYQRFREFWRTDLGGGTLPFDGEHPVTDEVVSMRCLGQEPRATLVLGGPRRDIRLTLRLEIIE